jgi:hypothetical protein
LTAQHEIERLAALRDLAVLDTPREERFDRVVRLAQRLFDVPMAVIGLLDADRQWNKASTGLDFQEGPRDKAFCNRTIQQGGRPFVVTDASLDLEFADNPFVLEPPAVRFYAGQPLAAPGGQLVGTLCILDDKPRDISPAELSLLRDLADWVEKELSMDAEMVRASDVQRQLLPRSAPSLKEYEVAGRCVPAHQVGGDFFDWFMVGEEFQVGVTDVMGKGLGAALIGATIRAMVRGASKFSQLGEAMRRAAAGLEADLAETGTFATLFCARLDPFTHRVRYVDAGHGLAFVLGLDGTIRRLTSTGLPLGTGFDDELDVHRTELALGDTLLVISDGLLDFFPTGAEAVEAVLEVHRQSAGAQELVDGLCRLGDGRARQDDVTAVALRRTGETGPAAPTGTTTSLFER